MCLPAVTLRPCTPDDLPLVAGWLAQPHVARYWREDPENR
jgi:aminoglycoside 6'-N-acetyltransferase